MKTELPYTTPLKKLAEFFLSSRDKWKKRSVDAHYQIKLQRNRIIFLEESKEKLKQENIELKKLLSEKKSNEVIENQDEIKKK